MGAVPEGGEQTEGGRKGGMGPRHTHWFGHLGAVGADTPHLDSSAQNGGCPGQGARAMFAQGEQGNLVVA